MHILNGKDEPRVFLTPQINASTKTELTDVDVRPQWEFVHRGSHAQYILPRCQVKNHAMPFELINDKYSLLNEAKSVDYTQ